MSDKGIEISPKYGLNPAIPVCFFCGQPKNEIVMLGRIRARGANGRAVRGSDLEAPKNTVFDYEPCDKCKKIMSQGITLIGVDKSDGKHMDIAKGLYPTGAYTVMKTEAFERIFGDCYNEEQMQKIKEGGKILIDHEVLEQLMGSAEE